jgi:hypothetical protein
MGFAEKCSSNIEISGTGIWPVVRAIRAEALCKVLLEKHGLTDVQRGVFYPLNNYLSLLDDMAKRMPKMLRKVGTFIMSEVTFPPSMTCFEDALRSTDEAYLGNHRGFEPDELGHYHFRKISEKAYLMSVACPFPCMFDQGVFLGMAQSFDTKIHIEHDATTCRRNGGTQCDYYISEI